MSAQTAPAAIAPSPGDATQAVDDPEPTGVRGFVRDVGSDYKHFVSVSTAKWLGVGTLATQPSSTPADEAIRDATQDDQAVLLSETAGQTYGNLSLQRPLAVTWWIIGHVVDSPRAAQAGRDLVRAQISALSWTYAVKYAVQRTRPNGDPRGFPSGHASAAFATAMVLQQHYGWKLGLPVFAIATYTAASRISSTTSTGPPTWCSGVLGMTSGRTVTVRLRGQPISLAPLAVPGGGGVAVSVRRSE